MCDTCLGLKGDNFLSSSSIPWIGEPATLKVYHDEEIFRLNIFVHADTFNKNELKIIVNQTVFTEG
jgi:hypothetical protein